MLMALFDRSEEESDGEVRISMKDDDQKEGKLKDEAEEKLSEGSESSSSGSSSDSTSMLPGVSGSETSSSTSGSLSRKDIHDQNKEIIELLNDIKKEVSSGGSNELL